MNLILKSDAFLNRRHYIVQVCIFYACIYLVLIPAMPFLYAAEEIKETGIDAGPHNFFAGLFVAPLLETLLNQYLIFIIFRKIPVLQTKYWWYISVSAICFGLLHSYSLRYIIFGIAEGLVLGYVFYFYRDNLRMAFWSTVLVHFLHNLTSYLFMQFTNI